MRNGAMASAVMIHGERKVEKLFKERSKRRGLPALDIAGRPVVEQAEAGDVVPGFGDRDGRADVIARPDPDADLHFVIQVAARTEGWCRLVRRPVLATGLPEL
jgi:hypothetical protein